MVLTGPALFLPLLWASHKQWELLRHLPGADQGPGERRWALLEFSYQSWYLSALFDKMELTSQLDLCG